MNKDWIIGFTEGDGCFSIQSRTQLPIFQITQKEIEILNKIRDFFGFGIVYTRCERNAPRFFVGSLNDCMKLVEFFDGHLESPRRREQFEKWKKLVLYRYDNNGGRHWTEKEDNIAKKMIREGSKSQEIAEKLHRTGNSIMARNGYKWHINFAHHLSRYPENFQYANVKEALE